MPRFVTAAVFLLVSGIFLPARLVYSEQPFIQITSPAEGAVMAPGESITVKVATSPGTSFYSFAIIVHSVEFPESNVLTSPPYQSTLVIPYYVRPGKYFLRASGLMPNRQGAVESAPIFIYIQRPVNPTK
jgi:hypothetical protein